jgi:hypothetical protein
VSARDGASSLTLSVVIAAWTGPEALARCLAALGPQLRAGEDEVIVARNFGGAWTMPDGVMAPTHDLVLPHSTNVPRLRVAGLEASSGRIVAFLEDFAVPATGWRDALVQAFVPPVRAVGGPVELASGGGALDWAVYFYDYGRFAPPLVSNVTESLSGVNVAYERALLDELTPALADGLHEATVERTLQQRGVTMWMAATAPVAVARRQRVGDAVALAYHLARGYAARRVAGAGVRQRVVRLAAAPLVPFVLFARAAGTVRRSPTLVVQFAAAAPWLFVLQCAWGIGEAVGSLAGAGDSDAQWR